MFAKNNKKMYYAIKGIYKDGKIILLEEAPIKEETEVIIIFLNEVEKDTESIKEKKRRVAGGLEGSGELPDDFNDMKNY
jgi:hypothetical protein